MNELTAIHLSRAHGYSIWLPDSTSPPAGSCHLPSPTIEGWCLTVKSTQLYIGLVATSGTRLIHRDKEGSHGA